MSRLTYATVYSNLSLRYLQVKQLKTSLSRLLVSIHNYFSPHSLFQKMQSPLSKWQNPFSIPDFQSNSKHYLVPSSTYVKNMVSSSGFPGGSVVKNLPASLGDVGSIPGKQRSPGEENGNPLQSLPGKSHEQRSLAGYNPQGQQRVRHD